MTYNWQAALLTLALVIGLTIIGKYLVFKVPALRKTREQNLAEDKVKKAKPKYRPVLEKGRKVGLGINLVFFIGVAPFILTLQAQPLWLIAAHVFAILMVYDFFYYLTHRFLFHGQGYLRRVHAVHHQARDITHIDAHYVHHVEIAIGVGLFLGTTALLAPLIGPFHVATIVITFLVFTQLNLINHNKVDLPYFPFRTLTWITKKHAVHHENMHKGNYATITLLYDKMFGTLD